MNRFNSIPRKNNQLLDRKCRKNGYLTAGSGIEKDWKDKLLLLELPKIWQRMSQI